MTMTLLAGPAGEPISRAEAKALSWSRSVSSGVAKRVSRDPAPEAGRTPTIMP